ncbi:type II toxin-antitoxin system VapC family toxin [uncultured Amnibacterium sp.]|uniref:type II toxin-antitoxin system VapC family toxin n=1 Tax=uncultured Amnibacterium sp. TaxID=1631851 RepID=UPI0035CA21F4
MRWYLDTSAAMKLLVHEPESNALVQTLNARGDADRLVGSWLLHTELHCAAARHPEAVEAGSVDAVLDGLTLVDLLRVDLIGAPTAGAGLRSQDALHLAVALRVDADAILTYDDEQAAAAERAGLAVLRPS